MKKSEQWKSHIKAQRGSGMSQSAYCARNGLSPSSFSYWHKIFTKKVQAGEGEFVSLATSAAPIEIAVGQVIIRVFPGSDLSELKQVVEALS